MIRFLQPGAFAPGGQAVVAQASPVVLLATTSKQVAPNDTIVMQSERTMAGVLSERLVIRR